MQMQMYANELTKVNEAAFESWILSFFKSSFDSQSEVVFNPATHVGQIHVDDLCPYQVRVHSYCWLQGLQ